MKAHLNRELREIFSLRRSWESFYDRAESFFIRRKLNKFEAGNIYTPEKLSPSTFKFNQNQGKNKKIKI